MKRLFQKILCITVSVVMLVAGVLPCFAVQRVMDGEDEKAYYTEFFNTQVNKIKSDMPYMVYTMAGGVSEGGLTIHNEDGEQELDEMATKYLLPVLDGLFNTNSSIAQGFVKTLFGDVGVRIDETVIHRQVTRNSVVPLLGEKVVSRLTPNGDFSIVADLYDDSAVPKAMLLTFVNTDLADVEGSSLQDAFSLPSGAINPVIIGGTQRNTQGFLENVKFTDFRFTDAKIQALFDEQGNLTHYRSQITYDFAISYLDAVKLVSAVLGYDLYQAFINTYTTIARNMGKDESQIQSFMETDKIAIQYIAVVDMNEINWSPRTFGDINDDNELNVVDARLALRYAVGEKSINSAANLVYADVNFDGVVDVADARLILRSTVGLEEKFDTVPEGKEIIIADLSVEPDTPEEPDDPDEQEEEFNGYLDGKFDPTVKLADIAQFVFDCINGVKGVEGTAMENIQGLIDIIKGIVAENRGKT